MGGYGSGGANRKPIEAHLLKGSFRADKPGSRPAAPVTPLRAWSGRNESLAQTSGGLGARRLLARPPVEWSAGWLPERKLWPTRAAYFADYVKVCEEFLETWGRRANRVPFAEQALRYARPYRGPPLATWNVRTRRADGHHGGHGWQPNRRSGPSAGQRSPFAKLKGSDMNFTP